MSQRQGFGWGCPCLRGASAGVCPGRGSVARRTNRDALPRNSSRGDCDPARRSPGASRSDAANRDGNGIGIRGTWLVGRHSDHVPSAPRRISGIRDPPPSALPADCGFRTVPCREGMCGSSFTNRDADPLIPDVRPRPKARSSTRRETSPSESSGSCFHPDHRGVSLPRCSRSET